MLCRPSTEEGSIMEKSTHPPKPFGNVDNRPVGLQRKGRGKCPLPTFPSPHDPLRMSQQQFPSQQASSLTKRR